MPGYANASSVSTGSDVYVSTLYTDEQQAIDTKQVIIEFHCQYYW